MWEGSDICLCLHIPQFNRTVRRSGGEDLLIGRRRHREHFSSMLVKAGDVVWRNFRKCKMRATHIALCINGFDSNWMSSWVGKTRKAIRRNNAVIIKFNDGIFFTAQSPTRF